MFSRSAASRWACSGVRVCNVVRTPPRASSTATAVPNDPAPTTMARRARGAGTRFGWRSATGRAYPWTRIIVRFGREASSPHGRKPINVPMDAGSADRRWVGVGRSTATDAAEAAYEAVHAAVQGRPAELLVLFASDAMDLDNLVRTAYLTGRR